LEEKTKYRSNNILINIVIDINLIKYFVVDL